MPTKIAICLYEDSIDSFDISELLCGQPLENITVNSKEPNTLLFLKETNTNIPDWVEIVSGFSDLRGRNTETASSGAILFLKLKERILACCFGSSVGNINRNNLVGDFGLAAAYQRIKKSDYKSIESHTLSVNPITNNRSAAIETTQDNFNIDNYLENITELSGKFLSKTGKVLIKGKEFYSTPSPLDLDAIKELCGSLVDDYNEAIDDEQYKRLTATKKIKIKSQIDFLNEKLCDKLTRKNEEVLLLDYESLSNLDSYSFSPKGRKYSEISIQDLYREYSDGYKISLPYLKKSKRITVFDSGNQEITQWPVFKCLFSSIQTNFGDCILFKGNWYAVEDRYLEDLRLFIMDHEIDSAKILLPKWNGICNEGDYNSQAAAALSAQCWDKVLYTCNAYSYGIEFCDILTPTYIIHVKKYASSSLNSHLLLQTAVSASLLKSDNGLIRWVNKESRKRFGQNIFFKSNGKFKNANAGYLILLLCTSKKRLSDILPFFSLVSFNLIIKKMAQLGYSVKVAKA